ncbi:MAG: amidohydrolase family protein [Oscillospiraceae bacterium]|nr:amidohydrolase family protein [Oscillospiraceae bacterium]
MQNIYALKGNICYSKDQKTIEAVENGYVVVENETSRGVFRTLPEKWANAPVTDYGDKLIIPGLVDLHIHAPQYAFRGTGMDLELLDWLNTYTFPEEARYGDLEYAELAYSLFADDLSKGATTRAVVFATVHVPATMLLMEKLERSGIVSLVGKVNMDRSSPAGLQEESAERSANDTIGWLHSCVGKFKNTSPILTPRFIPSCSDDLMRRLGDIQKAFKLPLQSHLSENQSEIEWVSELCPWSMSYGDAYAQFGMFGGENVNAVMAHCVWPTSGEIELIRKNGVYVAHCPQSNMNLASGIAPVRKFLEKNLNVGLGSDVAGGSSASVFRAMSDSIQVSKLYWRLVDGDSAPLTVEEAFYLGTLGGGRFFGKAGSFDDGFEFDAVIIDDGSIIGPAKPNIHDRLSKVIYLSDDRNIIAKYVRGEICGG